MKRYLSILLAAVMIFTIGCGKDTTKDNDNKDTKASPTVIVTVAPTQSAEPMQTTEPTETPSVTATISPAPTESADATQEAVTSTPTLVPSVDNTQSPSASEQTATVKLTAEPTVKPTSKPTVTVKPTVKPTATPTKAPTSKPTATEEEEIAYYRRLAAETVTEINKLRNVQLIVLPGLTKYAEYRAKQLETNFAHDLTDQRAASAALQYGEYKNNPPSQEELESILQILPNYVYKPYYYVPAGEAITTGLGTSAAYNFKYSPGHWRYVGSDEYLYIGVGASKGGTCVCVVKTNTDLLK